jgi:hypothetical protein
LLETAEGLAVELREIRELRENFACQIEEMKVHAEWLSKQSGLIINRLDK